MLNKLKTVLEVNNEIARLKMENDKLRQALKRAQWLANDKAQALVHKDEIIKRQQIQLCDKKESEKTYAERLADWRY
jgi:regulator of replication initiation timing